MERFFKNIIIRECCIPQIEGSRCRCRILRNKPLQNWTSHSLW